MSNFPEDCSTATIRGTPFTYVERGQGEPVVFVHGTCQDLRTWLPQIDAVSGAYRTIIYSRRYARPGADIPPGEDDPMMPHVDDLVALLQELNATPAHLVGNSWGGFISLLTAMREPALVRTLTLCEAPVLTLLVDNNPKPTQIAKLLLRRPADAYRLMHFGLRVVEPTKKAYKEGDQERANRIFGTALLGRKHFASLPEERQQMLLENQAVEAAQLLGTGFPPLPAADVRHIAAPTLLMTGDASAPMLRLTLTGELQRLIPNVERVTIPDASHLMHEDNPAAFNHALLSFLDRHRSAPV
jgi:pimeloyl-ACP methyl ester carboxylesterase